MMDTQGAEAKFELHGLPTSFGCFIKEKGDAQPAQAGDNGPEYWQNRKGMRKRAGQVGTMDVPKNAARRDTRVINERTAAAATTGFYANSVRQQQTAAKGAQELAADLVSTLDGNPALRTPCRVMLGLCAQEPQETGDLLAQAEQALRQSGELPVQSLSSLVEMLNRRGALNESLTVDGAPYEGTIEDAFNDPAITEDSQVLIFQNITACGRLVLDQTDPALRARQLFADKPQYTQALVCTLQSCDSEAGLTTKQLEARLDDQGFLYRDERAGIPHVYPSMYANFLKDVGCIRWDHAWITTGLGRQMALQMAG